MNERPDDVAYEAASGLSAATETMNRLADAFTNAAKEFVALRLAFLKAVSGLEDGSQAYRLTVFDHEGRSSQISKHTGTRACWRRSLYPGPDSSNIR